ncbi:MAG: hypothetical protein DRN95_04530 [Candidatus Hydrothermarchaeota archaeon]|nr:MAG: hypothetical protein DRN95_04530 [Candidatus Hydrothermarchaeota archaeon]
MGKKKEEEEKVEIVDIPVTRYETKDMLCELVWIKEKLRWCCYNFTTKKCVFKNSIDKEDIGEDGKVVRYRYIPDPFLYPFILEKKLFLPEMPEDYGSEEELTEEIMNFVGKYVDYPEKFYKIDPLFVRMTWIYDKFEAVPYRAAYSPFRQYGIGKSRWGFVVGAISYRGYVLGSNATPAVLFRLTNSIRGVPIIDESEFNPKTETGQALMQILNGGYSKSTGVVIRCEGPNNIPTLYVSYSPKLVATRRYFPDESTNSRTFFHHARETERKIPEQLPPEFYEESKKLRNKLLQWRFEHYKRNYNLNEIDLRDKIRNSRIREIMLPLYAIANNDEERQYLIEISKLKEKEEISKKQDTDEATIIRAFYSLFNENPERKGISLGQLREKAIKLDSSFSKSARKIGDILRRVFNGVEIKRMYIKELNSNPFAIELNKENLEKFGEAAVAYCIEPRDIEPQPEEEEEQEEEVDIEELIEPEQPENSEEEKESPEKEEEVDIEELIEKAEDNSEEQLNGGTKEDRITRLRMKYEGWNYGGVEI